MYVDNGLLHSIKKNEMMLFTAIWLDLESFMLRETDQRQISHNITDMGTLKNKTNICHNKTETDSQI